jgi:hypothetical protein
MMSADQITIQFAEITSVDSDKFTVSAQSRLDGAVIPNIPIDCPLNAQYIPVVGQQVLLIRIGDYDTRILAALGQRQFDAPIKPGELLSEGSGGGFLYLNRTGDAMLSDSALSNVLKMISTVGIQIVGDALAIDVKKIGKITIMNDEIQIIKTSGDSGSTAAKISLTNEKIVIEGTGVDLGKSPIGGCVFSMSGVTGPHSFCLVTGAPIPASGSVKAAT